MAKPSAQTLGTRLSPFTHELLGQLLCTPTAAAKMCHQHNRCRWSLNAPKEKKVHRKAAGNTKIPKECFSPYPLTETELV